MKYEKAKASVVLFDNSDVITGSKNCGHKTSGNSCNQNGTQKFEQCMELNHKAKPNEKELYDEFDLI